MQYFLADTHFGHKRILEFERERFKTIEQHDEFIMQRIEQTVKEGDELYFLGDFMLGKRNEDVIARFKKLRCKKIAIKGNHDKMKDLEEIFDEVHQYPLFLTDRILLSHDPEMVSPYVLNVHGHLHNSYLDSKNHLNVNIAMTNYSLYSLKAINGYLSRLEGKNTTFTYEWYADKYVFLKQRKDLALEEYGHLNVEKTRELLDKRFVRGTFLDFEGKEIELELKCLYKKVGAQIWVDETGQKWISENDYGTKNRYIYKCEVLELVSNRYVSGYEKWNRCHNNGKTISQLFPKATNQEKYAYLCIQKEVS